MDERDLTTKSAAWDSCVRSNGRGYKRGWRAACEALAEWQDSLVKIEQQSAKTAHQKGRGEQGNRHDDIARAHESSAAECRRRVGE